MTKDQYDEEFIDIPVTRNIFKTGDKLFEVVGKYVPRNKLDRNRDSGYMDYVYKDNGEIQNISAMSSTYLGVLSDA